MKLNTLLTTLGLTEHEQRIYLAILKAGHASIAQIVAQTKLHRPTVYQWLPSLIDKHLLSFSMIGKRKVYYAESPEQLTQLAGNLASALNEALPELLSLYKKRDQKPTVQFFQGDKIVTQIYEDVLTTCKKGDIFYRYESPRDYKQLDKLLPPAYFERICHKKEIQKFVITNEKTARSKPNVVERISRGVPKQFDVFEYDITQIIYNHKVAFIDLNTNTAWIIANKPFADFQRQLFKLLFQYLHREQLRRA